MDVSFDRKSEAIPTREDGTREAALAGWKEPPPWGCDWKSFFSSFARCVVLNQPGMTVTDLYGCTSGDTPSTVPQIRESLTAAMEAGLVLRILDERPDGTREYYGLNPDSWVLAKIMGTPSEVVAPVSNDQGVQAVRKFSQLLFNNLAIECGFEDGSRLTAERVIDFFANGPYHITEMYKSKALYPDGVEVFYQPVRTFIDTIVKQAVDSGVLQVSVGSDGRELYSLLSGVAGLKPLKVA